MKYLDPDLLNRIARRTFESRFVMGGHLSGIHRSPFKGVSVEFTAHREYAPGDELRHLDWKVYAKSDRFFVKEHEAESNLKALLFLDASGSMGYRGRAGLSKFEYACYLATALAHVLLSQGDQVGLVVFDEDVRRTLPPSGKRTQLLSIAQALERAAPQGRTGLSRVLAKTASDVGRRGLTVVISDLLDDPTAVVRGLRLFRHRRHEVVVFHVLHGDEVDFPFDGMTRFEDLEADRRVTADPEDVAHVYRPLVQQFIGEYRTLCRKDVVDYQLSRTDVPLETALVRYLAARG
ncbi:MAG: DUF58 domain-containing protein [Candidatus Tectomicrobia bacterium]|nr:DUF58 domain-containing protein [Candidatus Tectomicrobia bacterium]